jgi:hypothetical protein
VRPVTATRSGTIRLIGALRGDGTPAILRRNTTIVNLSPALVSRPLPDLLLVAGRRDGTIRQGAHPDEEL